LYTTQRRVAWHLRLAARLSSFLQACFGEI
jgi:hypothetical protein